MWCAETQILHFNHVPNVPNKTFVYNSYILFSHIVQSIQQKPLEMLLLVPQFIHRVAPVAGEWRQDCAVHGVPAVHRHDKQTALARGFKRHAADDCRTEQRKSIRSRQLLLQHETGRKHHPGYCLLVRTRYRFYTKCWLLHSTDLFVTFPRRSSY